MRRELPNRDARLLLVNTLFPLLIAICAMLSLTPEIDREIIKAGNASLRAVIVLPVVASKDRTQ